MIKNLIFDIGYVLIEYHWREVMIRHGISPEETERIAAEMFESEIWWKRLDGGMIDLEGAIREYRKAFPEDFEVIEWVMRHPELMHEFRPEVWEKALKLKKAGYRIYLLSNYSEHLLKCHLKGTGIAENVDGAIISCRVHVIKPEPGIYRALLETYDLKPEECLFFDDRADNVQGAIDAGMHATQILSREMINAELQKLLESTCTPR